MKCRWSHITEPSLSYFWTPGERTNSLLLNRAIDCMQLILSTRWSRRHGHWFTSSTFIIGGQHVEIWWWGDLCSNYYICFPSYHGRPALELCYDATINSKMKKILLFSNFWKFDMGNTYHLITNWGDQEATKNI